MAEILSLATAALKPGQMEDTAHLIFPRVDYVELQRARRLDVLDYAAYQRSPFGNPLRRLETQLRSDVYLTLLGFLRSRRYRMLFAWSERAGIPFAALRRVLPHNGRFLAMFTCWSDRQEKMITRFNLFSAMDGIAVHCQSMKDHFLGLGVPQNKVKVIHYSIDHRFFSPIPEVEQEPGLILSVGEIRSRDYASFFKAVEGLPVKVLAATGGAWYAREKATGLHAHIPENVILPGRLSLVELKHQYARAQFVVLPLYDQVFSAGSTASLEAMCMGRAVIAFASRGIRDYVVDGETGILVEPGNAGALRQAIQFLLDHPQEAHRMGENGRRRIENGLNLDRYLEQVACWLESYL